MSKQVTSTKTKSTSDRSPSDSLRKRTSNDLLQIEEGSLYPALQRLLKEELLKAEWSISTTNRRVRIYKLTAMGAKHLEREVSSFETMLEGITRVLAPVKS